MGDVIQQIQLNYNNFAMIFVLSIAHLVHTKLVMLKQQLQFCSLAEEETHYIGD